MPKKTRAALAAIQADLEPLNTRIAQLEAGTATTKALAAQLTKVGQQVGGIVKQIDRLHRDLLKGLSHTAKATDMLKAFGQTAKVASEQDDRLAEALERIAQLEETVARLQAEIGRPAA